MKMTHVSTPKLVDLSTILEPRTRQLPWLMQTHQHSHGTSASFTAACASKRFLLAKSWIWRVLRINRANYLQCAAAS